jgi:phospholipid/cholesterol/gamma-HCH transport system substrate-binding protein
MNKKTAVWGLAAVVIAGSAYFISKRSSFSSDHIYYGYYADVRGLQESSPIFLQGVKVGSVSEIDLNIKDKVRVVFAIDEELKLQEGTAAVISTGDMTGSKSVRLEPGNGRLLPPGSILKASFDSTMAESFNARISPMIETGKVLLHSTDSALYSFNRLIKQGWGEETRRSFVSIDGKMQSAATASGRANQSVQNMQGLVNSLDSMTRNPQEKIASLSKNLANAAQSSGEAVRSDFSQNLKELNESVSRISANITKAKNHKMLTDTSAYQGLSRSLDTFSRSTKSYMDDPPPLINIGFGGKKK